MWDREPQTECLQKHGTATNRFPWLKGQRGAEYSRRWRAPPLMQHRRRIVRGGHYPTICVLPPREPGAGHARCLVEERQRTLLGVGPRVAFFLKRLNVSQIVSDNFQHLRLHLFCWFFLIGLSLVFLGFSFVGGTTETRKECGGQPKPAVQTHGDHSLPAAPAALRRRAVVTHTALRAHLHRPHSAPRALLQIRRMHLRKCIVCRQTHPHHTACPLPNAPRETCRMGHGTWAT